MRAMGLASADRGGADSRPLCALSKQRFSSVWDSIENTPEEAANMKLRSALMTALKDYISGTKMSQARAAKLFCVTQPRVSDLMRGKINLFALDELVNMAVASGNIMPDGSAIFRAKTKSILGLAGTLKRPKGKKVSVQDMNAWRRR